jgi:hypothetical protein
LGDELHAATGLAALADLGYRPAACSTVTTSFLRKIVREANDRVSSGKTADIMLRNNELLEVTIPSKHSKHPGRIVNDIVERAVLAGRFSKASKELADYSSLNRKTMSKHLMLTAFFRTKVLHAAETTLLNLATHSKVNLSEVARATYEANKLRDPHSPSWRETAAFLKNVSLGKSAIPIARTSTRIQLHTFSQLQKTTETLYNNRYTEKALYLLQTKFIPPSKSQRSDLAPKEAIKLRRQLCQKKNVSYDPDRDDEDFENMPAFNTADISKQDDQFCVFRMNVRHIQIMWHLQHLDILQQWRKRSRSSKEAIHVVSGDDDVVATLNPAAVSIRFTAVADDDDELVAIDESALLQTVAPLTHTSAVVNIEDDDDDSVDLESEAGTAGAKAALVRMDEQFGVEEAEEDNLLDLDEQSDETTDLDDRGATETAVLSTVEPLVVDLVTADALPEHFAVIRTQHESIMTRKLQDAYGKSVGAGAAELQTASWVNISDPECAVVTAKKTEMIGSSKVLVSRSTVLRTLHRWGWKYFSRGACILDSGHERPDVVQSRDEYISTLMKMQNRIIKVYTKENWMLLHNAGALHHFTDLEQAALGVRLTGDERPLLVIFHDESAFHGNRVDKRSWGKPGESFKSDECPEKGLGPGVMVSAFMSGFGVHSTRITRSGKHFGHWTIPRMLDHTTSAFYSVMTEFPVVQPVFIFDNSSCHRAVAEDALRADRMNVTTYGRTHCRCHSYRHFTLSHPCHWKM